MTYFLSLFRPLADTLHTVALEMMLCSFYLKNLEIFLFSIFMVMVCLLLMLVWERITVDSGNLQINQGQGRIVYVFNRKT